MAEEIIVGVNDRAIASAIQQELSSKGLNSTRLQGGQSPHFGVRLHARVGQLEISAEEIIQLMVATPEMVDAVLGVIELFKNRDKVK